MKGLYHKYLSYNKIALAAFVLVLLYVMPWKGEVSEEDHKSFVKQFQQNVTGQEEENIMKRYFDDHFITRNASGKEFQVKVYNNDKSLITDGVIIFSSMSSGSAFLGEFFNNFPEVFYLFEPLHAFGWSVSQKNERMKLLQDIMLCDFSAIPEQYKEISEKLKLDDSVARCLQDNICFYPRSNFLHRDTNLCNKTTEGKVNCHLPFPTDHLSTACRKSLFPTVQIIAEPYVESLDQVTDTIPANIRTIQLVRDPRAVLATQNIPQADMVSQANRACNLLLKNVEYGNRLSPKSYLLLRYENLMTEPVTTAKRIFDFINIDDIDTAVTSWIETNSGNSVVDSWRNDLNFEETATIQESCHDVLTLLGYSLFENEEALKNLTRSVLE